MTAEYKVHGDVAVITLNNPPVNGLGYATRIGITDALARANADSAVKSIVLTGAGKAFSGGADIREFGSPKATQEPNLLSVISALEHSGKPVVAAVHSVCMGGGLELALGCHYRIAAPGCSVALPEVKLGLIPGAGGTQRLPRFVGKALAMEMVLNNRILSAEEARQLGMLNRVVPVERYLDEALTLAAELAARAPLALRLAKEAVNNAFESPLSAGLAAERRAFHFLFSTQDQKEGMTAFVEKRQPAWKGV
jgi:3-hydroxyacyl-CoA dehydrogenase